MTDLTMAAFGISFDNAAEFIGMLVRELRKQRKQRDANEFIELAEKKINLDINKLSNNFYLCCCEIDKSARALKLKAYAKKDVIQFINQIVKDNVLDRIQNRELRDIRNLLIL